ncbi:hypothetical protein BH11PSE11_BH11PSE11_17520 [soil metagenome]
MPIILIADDVIGNVRLLKNLLQEFGQIVFAENGLDALAQAERHHPDIILLDVMMPGLDGYETCRRLKAQPRTRDIPVIFITGADSEVDEATGLACGAIDYIAKPFAPAIVKARVQNHLSLVRVNAALRQANDALRKFKAAVDCSSAAVVITDRDARIEYVNATFVDSSGYSAAEALGQTPALLKSGQTSPDTYASLWQTILGGANWRGELRNQRKDGSVLWEDVAIAPVYDEQRTITHFVAINSDISQRKQLEDELRRMATTDALSGVANRRHLMDMGEQEIMRARRSATPFCMLMLDIDHFKRVNDSLGHPAGDAVIQALAQICSESVRTIDTVGRFGGEEFAILLPATDLAGATELAERICARAAAHRVGWQGREIQFTVSIGVAQVRQRADAACFATLIGLADQALYQAKNAGRNRVVVSQDDGKGKANDVQ